MSTENGADPQIKNRYGYELIVFFGPNINKCHTAKLLSVDLQKRCEKLY